MTDCESAQNLRCLCVCVSSTYCSLFCSHLDVRSLNEYANIFSLPDIATINVLQIQCEIYRCIKWVLLLFYQHSTYQVLVFVAMQIQMISSAEEHQVCVCVCAFITFIHSIYHICEQYKHLHSKFLGKQFKLMWFYFGFFISFHRIPMKMDGFILSTSS